ncbi:MAG: hypothetical protein ACPGLY_27795, partial [Rubripirellula sp.]
MALERRDLKARTEGSSVDIPMSALTFGAKNVRAFVGTGEVDKDNNGVVDADAELKTNNAMGLSVTIDEMALALLKPQSLSSGLLSDKTYFALDASGTAALIGVEEVTLEGDVNIRINQGRLAASGSEAAVAPAINFKASAAANSADYSDVSGLKVKTGPGTTDVILLNFEEEVRNAEGFLNLGLSEYVHVSGNFAIEKASTPISVTLADTSTVNDVSLLKIGASNVNAFVGSGGPYWTADLNNNETVDTDEINEAATGLVLNDIAFGLALMKEQAASDGSPAHSFYALQATGGGELVGIADVTATASNLLIQVNSGTDGNGGDATVNFITTFPADGSTPAGMNVDTGDGNSIQLAFDRALTSVGGQLELSAHDLVEAHTSFTMTQETVDVNYDTSTGVDLDDADLLLINLDLKDPDPNTAIDSEGNRVSGPKRALSVGHADGVNFGVDSGQLTLAAVNANPDPTKTPESFDRTYSAFLGSVRNVTLNGIPEDPDRVFSFEAIELNASFNGSTGTDTSSPERLDWTTMIDLDAGATTFQADEVIVGGNAITLTDADSRSIGGQLKFNIDGFVLGSGSFQFDQTSGQQVSDGDGTTLVAGTNSNGPIEATVQTLAMDDVNLFVGLNGSFQENSTGEVTGINTDNATGVSATGGRFDLVTVSESTGNLRSWTAFAMHADSLSLHGLPTDFSLDFQDLNLLYNTPDESTSSKLDWSKVTVGGKALTALTAFATTDPADATALIKITDTTDFAIRGGVHLNIRELVLGAGQFDIVQKTGLSVNDGNGVTLENASQLLISLSGVHLFTGAGAEGITAETYFTETFHFQTELESQGAQGFYVGGAGLDIAILTEDSASLGSGTSPRTWTGLAAEVGLMTPIGLPSDVDFKVSDLEAFYNVDAADSSRVDWKALAQQADNVFLLDNTALANLEAATEFNVTGAMLASLDNYAYLSGSMALERRDL